MRLIHKAWSAGFWEGEGSGGVYPRGEYPPLIKLSACQREPEPLEKLQRLFGGRLGRAGGIWEWNLRYEEMPGFIYRVLPFVQNPRKREQLQAILQEVTRRLEAAYKP